MKLCLRSLCNITVHQKGAFSFKVSKNNTILSGQKHGKPYIFPEISLVWISKKLQVCILEQLSTTVSMKVMDIYLAALRLGEYPSLLTSTSVKNC